MNLKKISLIVGSILLIGAVTATSIVLIGNYKKNQTTSESNSENKFGLNALKINGKYVEQSKFTEEYNKFYKKNNRDSKMLSKSDEERNDIFLNQFIETMVLEDYVLNKSDIKVKDEEVTSYIDKYIKTKYSKKEDFEAFLSGSGYSNESELKKGIKSFLTQQGCFYKAANEYKIELSDDELNEKYNEYLKQIKKIDFKTILISSNKRSEDEALKIAQEVKSKIESGEDFKELAKQYSDDEESKKNGGAILGQIFDAHDANIADKVFEANEGDLIGPEKVISGYEIAKIDKITLSARTKEEYKEIQVVAKFKSSKEYTSWYENILKSYKIEITDPSMNAYRNFAKKNYKNAIISYKKVYELTKDPLINERIVECYINSKEWDKAIDISKEIVKEQPENIRMRLAMAESYYGLKNTSEMKKIMKEAEELSKDNLYNLSMIKNSYEKIGLTADAERVGAKIKIK